MAEQYQNSLTDPTTTINDAGGISDSDTTVTVADGTTLPSSGDFRLRIEDEIVIGTARTGNDVTITRAAEGTTAVAHADGVDVNLVQTAESVQNLAGVSVLSGTVAALPAASRAGRLYWPTDGIYQYRDSGSAWQPFFGGIPVTEPVSGDFSWVNQGTSSLNTTNGGVFLRAPTGGDTEQLRCRVKTAPSTPYTIVVGFRAIGFPLDGNAVGICFRESSTGKLSVFWIGVDAPATPALEAYRYTNATTISTSYFTDQSQYNIGDVYMRMQDDGVNRIFSYGADPYNFITMLTVSRTEHMAGGADQVGHMLRGFDAIYESGQLVFHWKET